MSVTKCSGCATGIAVEIPTGASVFCGSCWQRASNLRDELLLASNPRDQAAVDLLALRQRIRDRIAYHSGSGALSSISESVCDERIVAELTTLLDDQRYER